MQFVLMRSQRHNPELPGQYLELEMRFQSLHHLYTKMYIYLQMKAASIYVLTHWLTSIFPHCLPYIYNLILSKQKSQKSIACN